MFISVQRSMEDFPLDDAKRETLTLPAQARANGDVRNREKVRRGLKEKETPILAGFQIFRNCIRGHDGLEGKTPAEACGIQVKAENKWMTLIQHASHHLTVNTETYPPTKLTEPLG